MKPPFNYTTKHFLLHFAVLLLLCGVVVFHKFDLGWSSSVNISATVALGPPTITDVTNTAPSVDITWNKSLSADYGHVAEYEVWKKLKTEDESSYVYVTPSYAHDGSASYTKAVTDISTTQGTDFIMYAVTAGGFKSAPSNMMSNYFCGDGTVDPGEDCDGANLDGNTCTTIGMGFGGGTLSCTAVCTFNVSACFMGGGGGGSSPPADTIPPVPGTATIPIYANSKPITITYTGASDTGGSGLAYVALWYKKGTGSWINSGATSTGSSGSFSFNGFTTNDTYYFDLVAHDNAGNQSSPASGSGQGATIYDITIPVPGTATSPATSADIPINVNYTGASDAGGSGLKHVELWYKKGTAGTWTDSGLKSTTASGTFVFTNITGNDTYYFDLVAEDKAGNRSAAVSGSGDTSTVYSVIMPTAVLSGLPNNPTYLTTTNITVGGTDVTAYKYKLDGGSYGAETPVATKIALSGLTSGTHTLYVIGKNSIGNWQLETSATQHTWTVDFTVPTIAIGNPSISLSTGANVTYTVTYTNASTITLSAANVTLNRTGTANGSVAVSGTGTSTRTVTISNITGFGTLNISIAANTAQRNNGTSAAAAGPSNIFNVNVYVPACGNGIKDDGEECDDGNTISGDGCSSTCTIETEVDHCTNGIKDADEEDIDCGGADCMACHLAAPEHCTDNIMNEDEIGVDCGGENCIPCITVNFLALMEPEGRTVSAGYGAPTNIELNRRSISKVTNVKSVLFNSLGEADFDIGGILPSNYDVGIKGVGYLRSVIYNTPLLTEEYPVNLDFTFGGGYKLIGGDVWPDNIINAADVAQIIKTYGTVNASIDLNRDGLVNAADVALVLRNYFKVGDSYF